MRRNLRARLRRAHGQAAAERQAGPSLRPALEQQRQRARERGLRLLPPAELQRNSQGEFYLRQLRYPLEHRHGGICLAQALNLDSARLAPLCPHPGEEEIDPHQALFLDTETTGLSGAAGTLVFMTGLGYFEGAELVVEQTFLRNHSEEAASLQHVASRLQQYPQLVSFVGKSFDRHRLANRMVLHRIRSSMLTARHLDLYYLARRRYRDELADVRLQTLERERLGLERDDDLPGAEAPQAFFDWYLEGRGQIARVFEHNRLDVLSLVTLLADLGGAQSG